MLKNIGSNWILMAVSGLATLLLLPFNVHSLGTVQYGIWLLISAQTAYLALLHLGVPMASVREMTQAIAKDDTEQLNQLIASCSILYIGMGLIAGGAGLVLLIGFERSYAIAPGLQATARAAYLVALVQISLLFIGNMPFAILTAYQQFVTKNSLHSLAVLVRMAVNLALVIWFPSILMVALAVLSATLCELVCGWGYVLARFPAVRPRLHHVQGAALWQVGRFSIYVFMLALGGQLAFQTSALVIGHLMTPVDVVSFGVPNSLMLILFQFVGGISSVMMPLATTLHTRGEAHALRDLLYKWTKISLALTWCAALFLLVFGPSFLSLWINKAYTPESGQVLRILMVAYAILLPIYCVVVPMLMGIGDAKWLTIAIVAAGVLNVVLAFLWVPHAGLEGAAWSTLVSNVALSAAMIWLACRTLGIRVVDYLTATMPMALIGAFAALAVLIWWQRLWQPSGLIGLGIAGVLTVALGGVIWAGLVLRNDRHVVVPRMSDLIPWRLQW